MAPCYCNCACPDLEAGDSTGYVVVQFESIPPKMKKLGKTPCMFFEKDDGRARFHRQRFDQLEADCRGRITAKSLLSQGERDMLQLASETAELHDSAEAMAGHALQLATLLTTSSNAACFTGAGISTSAGIGDYRGPNGKWTQDDRAARTAGAGAAVPVAITGTGGGGGGGVDEEEEAVVDEPDGVEYEELRPTYTHEALALLSRLGVIKAVISQNGDGLHLLSGLVEESSGGGGGGEGGGAAGAAGGAASSTPSCSAKVFELHGNVFMEHCNGCGGRFHRTFYTPDDEPSEYVKPLSAFLPALPAVLSLFASN